jgi:hypothetical protein
MEENDSLDGVFGYGDEETKKFSIFLSMKDPNEKAIYDKLMRINKSRRNFLIVDILIRYFKSGTNEEQLINALENISIFIRDIRKLPAMQHPPVQQVVKVTQTETRSVEMSRSVEGGNGESFINQGVSLEEIANNQPKMVSPSIEEKKIDMDDLIGGIFENGIQK